MTLFSLISVLIIGGLAGWLAGRLVKGYGLGVIGNIAVGVAGAFIAQVLFPRIGMEFDGGMISGIIRATLGAVLLLVLIRVVKRV